jgi:hypothetical protein
MDVRGQTVYIRTRKLAPNAALVEPMPPVCRRQYSTRACNSTDGWIVSDLNGTNGNAGQGRRRRNHDSRWK